MAEEEARQCRPFLASASKLVTLSFEVAGREIDRLPERIVEALRSSEVQKAIKAALDKEAAALLADQQKGKETSADRGEVVLKNLGKATFDAASSEILRQVEHSPQVKKLEREAKGVLQDFECSRVGVWVNKNRTLVIVVGAVLALAAGAAFYFAKSGDFVGQLAEGKGKVIKLGAIEISGKITKFKPSTQEVGAVVGLAADWKPLKLELALSGHALGSKGTVSADGRIMVPLTDRLSAASSLRLDVGEPLHDRDPRMRLLSTGLKTGWNQYHYRVAAGLVYDDKSLKVDLLGYVDNFRPGATLGATYQADIGDWRLKAGVGADLAPGNLSARGTVGLASRRRDLPLELMLGGKASSSGILQLEATLVARF